VGSSPLEGDTMEKYGVKIDPDKVEREKISKKGEERKPYNNPKINVPYDPDKGTEPFEETDEKD